MDDESPVDIAFHYVLQSYSESKRSLEAVERRIEFQLTLIASITLFGAIATLGALGDRLIILSSNPIWPILPIMIAFIAGLLIGLYARSKGEFRSVDPYKMLCELEGLPSGIRKKQVIELSGDDLDYNSKLIESKSKLADLMIYVFAFQITYGLGAVVGVLI